VFRVDNIPTLFSKIFSERHSQSARAQGAKELEKLTVSMVKVLLERSGVMKHGEQVAKRLQRAEDERSDLHAQVRMLEKTNTDLVAHKEELARDLADADRNAEKLEKELRALKRAASAAATSLASPVAVAADGVVKGEDGNWTMLVSGQVWLIWCECVTHVFTFRFVLIAVFYRHCVLDAVSSARSLERICSFAFASYDSHSKRC